MNLFDLEAKISLDTSRFEAGIKKAGAVIKGASVTIANYGEKIVSVGEQAAKTFIATETAVATAVGGIVKKSVDGFGSFEQLVGGVETLFKGSADTVVSYANDAYKTAGFSANAYMETVTSFSASLIQSLDGDTVKAAEYADKAITDMSDNAAKFGSDIETLKTAYAGFSKGQFQLLDNLKLGYGGTRSEMKRLIKDAEAISGKDLNIKNYSDIIEAIHIIQENMGITGTTAREAASTIQGSVAMAKMAFDNFAVGLADGNQDIGKLFDNLMESVGIAADNIAPRIVTSIDRIGDVVEEHSDDIAGFIGGFVTQAAAQAPKFIRVTNSIIKQVIRRIDANKDEMAETGLAFFETLVDSFEETLDLALPIIETLSPTVARAIMRGGTALFNAGSSIILSVVEGVASNSDQLAETAVGSIIAIVDTVDTNLDKFLAAGEKIVVSIAGSLVDNGDKFLDSALSIIETLAGFITGNLPELLPAAVGMILGIVEGLTNPDTLGALIDAAIPMLLALADGIVDSLPLLLESALTIVSNLVMAIGENAGKLVNAAIEIIFALNGALVRPEMLSVLIKGAVELIGAIVSGLISHAGNLMETGRVLIEKIKEGFSELNPIEWGADLVDGFIEGMKSGWGNLTGAVKETAQKVKNFLGFSEPEEGPLSDFHTYAPDMIDLFVKGVKDNEKRLQDQIGKTFDFGEKTVDSVRSGKYIRMKDKDDALLLREKDGGEKTVNIEINVDGAEYESDTELAEKIARILEDLFRRKD